MIYKIDNKLKVEDISYDDIFSNFKKQKKVAKMYVTLLDIRSQILKEQETK